MRSFCAPCFCWPDRRRSSFHPGGGAIEVVFQAPGSPVAASAPPAAATSFTPAPQSAPTAAPVPPSAPHPQPLHRRSACAAAPDAGATDGHTAVETITTDPRNRASFTPPAGSPSSRSASAEAFAATLGDHRALSFSTGPAHPPLRWPHGAVGTGVVCRIYWAAFRVSTASRRDGGGSPPRLS